LAVRLWATDDLAAIAAFSCTDRGRRYTRDAQDVIRDAAGLLTKGDPALDCLVAIEITTGRLVGVIVYNPCGPDQIARVRSLGVVKDRRRQGIGITLKQCAIECFAEAGATKYFSEVHQRNDKMMALNGKLGIKYKREPSNGKYLIFANTIQVISEESELAASQLVQPDQP
jgi:hypothetical protein